MFRCCRPSAEGAPLLGSTSFQLDKQTTRNPQVIFKSNTWKNTAQTIDEIRAGFNCYDWTLEIKVKGSDYPQKTGQLCSRQSYLTSAQQTREQFVSLEADYDFENQHNFKLLLPEKMSSEATPALEVSGLINGVTHRTKLVFQKISEENAELVFCEQGPSDITWTFRACTKRR